LSASQHASLAAFQLFPARLPAAFHKKIGHATNFGSAPPRLYPPYFADWLKCASGAS
jgi:hypothetical protein